jgi:hypothetical protein
MENWLRYPGLAELKRGDRVLLTPRFERLARDANSVAVLVTDLLLQLQLSEKHHGREATQRDHATSSGRNVDAPDRPRIAGGSDDGAPCPGPHPGGTLRHNADDGSAKAIVTARFAR